MSARVILWVLAAAVIMPRASTQDQQPQLIDQEVKASYCLGYFKADHEMRQRLCQKSQDTSKVVALCALGAQSDAKMQRITDYLAANGFLTRHDATSAAIQGRNDYRECVSWAKSQAAADCAEKCPQQSLQQHLLCVSACKPVACRQVEMCEILDYLPN